MRFTSLCLPGILSILPAFAALQQPVRTETGLIQGIAGSDSAVMMFKGIPFAAPPVGDLRWRGPKPAAHWSGVRRADQFGASCIQTIVEERKPWTYEFMTHTPISEDCLYLNVWSAAQSAGEKRPVFVWLYGGGYTEGSSAVPVYDGERLARRGLVVVTVNYRLGVFGFLAHPELTKESDHNASGNYGTLDQIAALQWVQMNIAAFGGDPGRVTIAGQSAGANSVHNLVASPLAKGLFHRAIAESGSGVTSNNRTATLEEAEKGGLKFAESRGAKSIAALRAISWQDLVSGTRTGNSSNFRPIVDGWVLPETLETVTTRGLQNDVPTLTGLNADEGSSSADYGMVRASEFTQQIRKRFGEMAEEFLKLYPFGSDQQAGDMEKTSAREQGLISMYLWAAHRARTGQTKAFTYYWTHPEPGPDQQRYGAFHTSEVPYVFDSLRESKRPWTDADHKLADLLGSYWFNFAVTGDPNGPGLPQWPAFDEKQHQTMGLGDHSGARSIASKAKIDFFARYFVRSGR
jgi:para-nitrobenzyl esterase